MDDGQIITLFFQRSEQAISEISGKYGTLCARTRPSSPVRFYMAPDETIFSRSGFPSPAYSTLRIEIGRFDFYCNCAGSMIN